MNFKRFLRYSSQNNKWIRMNEVSQHTCTLQTKHAKTHTKPYGMHAIESNRIESAMHVMYTNCFALLSKKTSAISNNPIVCSFVCLRNHLLFDEFIYLQSHNNFVLLSTSPHRCACIQRDEIIDLFEMWICIENVNDLFYELFTIKFNCKWPRAEKNAIHSKCKIQFSLQTNTWSATFFWLSNIEFFISYPFRFAIEIDRNSILCVREGENAWVSNFESNHFEIPYHFYRAHRFHCTRWCMKRKEKSHCCHCPYHQQT